MSAHVSTFEGYLHAERAEAVEAPQRCDGCLREDQRCWVLGRGNRMVMCEACLRTIHGDDMGEARTLRALLGAAVAAALEAGIAAASIRAVIDEAIDADIARDVREEAWALELARGGGS